MGIDYKYNQQNKIHSQIIKGEITPSEAITLLIKIEKQKDNIQSKIHKKGDTKNIDEIMEELDSLIGLKKVKKLVKEIRAFIEIQKRRKEEGLNNEPLVMHMIFKGNPGTGKTTVARIIGSLFKELDVLPKGHLIEVERADLVGEYIGHTAQKTRDLIKKAMGGILFIDEAYSLARGGQRDFGKESIDCLTKAMEDQKENFVLILAGYEKEMEFFIRSNPGLRSRFPIHIDFPDYTIDELMEIAKLMLAKREYKLSVRAYSALKDILLNNNYKNQDRFGNARLVRNLIEKAIRRQAVRLIDLNNVTREDLILIIEDDIKGVEDN